ncbi:MAG: hypothetical protein L6416_10675 [Candidatus Omnitrophica bacterium]|nr:hypothetical protein [Candidatus Omnitrophota bacterium]
MTFEKFTEDYSQKGLIKKHPADFSAIENLISRGYKEIKIAQANIPIDEGIAFTTAYTAMLHAGRALMFSKGFRPIDGYQHKTVVNFASIILGTEYEKLVLHFDKMRRKRNLFTYEASISISVSEVKSALKSASNFVKITRNIVEKNNPQHRFKFNL